jgi:hypothetical protein
MGCDNILYSFGGRKFETAIATENGNPTALTTDETTYSGLSKTVKSIKTTSPKKNSKYGIKTSL